MASDYCLYLEMIKDTLVDVRPNLKQLSVLIAIDKTIGILRAPTKVTCTKKRKVEREYSMIPNLIPIGHKTVTYIFMLSMAFKSTLHEQAHCFYIQKFIRYKFPQACPFWTTHIRRYLKSGNFECLSDAKIESVMKIYRIKRHLSEQVNSDMANFLESRPSEVRRLWMYHKDLRNILEVLAYHNISQNYKLWYQVRNLIYQSAFNIQIPDTEIDDSVLYGHASGTTFSTANKTTVPGTANPQPNSGGSVSDGTVNIFFGATPSAPTNHSTRKLFGSNFSGSRHEQYNKINKKFRKQK